MRRNDIVLVGKPDLYNFYGRIVEKIDDEHYKVVDCGRACGIWHYTDLTLANNYKGYKIKKCHDISEWRYNCMEAKYCNEGWVDVMVIGWPNFFEKVVDESGNVVYMCVHDVFVRMPTLRHLKQMCAKYDKNVWKKNQRRKK